MYACSAAPVRATTRVTPTPRANSARCLSRAGTGWCTAAGWVFSSLLVGVAGMASTVWFARRYIGRLSSPALARRYLDDLSGCNLNRAQQHVDEIRRFMRE